MHAHDDISVKEAAELLKVSEKTVYRWVRQGVVPAFKLQGQYRFDRPELEAWARARRIGAGGVPASGGPMNEDDASLYPGIQRGGIHYKVEGETPQEVFEHVVEFFPAGGTQALRDTLLQTLLEREALVSTGIGHGIALPHPRHPRDWGLGGPTVGVCFLEHPVDFKAMDGEPVFVLFVILCATVKGHLKLLSQVSHLVNQTSVRDFLRTEPTRSELLERIRDALPAQPSAR